VCTVAFEVALDLFQHLRLANRFGWESVDAGFGMVDETVPKQTAQRLDVDFLGGYRPLEPEAAEFLALVLQMVPVENEVDLPASTPELEDCVLERTLAVGEEQ